MPDPEVPQFRVSNEGDPIPPVDPEDLKRNWKIQGDKEAWLAASQEANSAAISKRCWMIKGLTHDKKGQLLAPWKHGEELDDAVFRVAATFPIRPLRQHTYMLPGDSMQGYDPNVFVEKLIEETGIPHTWEPVLTRIPEGDSGCTYIKRRVGRAGLDPRDPEALKKFMAGDMSEGEARRDARELLWAVWSKCQPNLSRPSRKIPDGLPAVIVANHYEFAAMGVAMQFADFAIDNIDLARKFFASRTGGGDRGRDQLTIVLELERRATWLDWLECSVCQRLMRDHSDEEMARCKQALPPGTTLYRFRNS
jgi:hypothetical protein